MKELGKTNSESNKVLVIVEKAQNNYSAYIPELDGCIATDTTFQGVKKLMKAALEFHLEGIKEYGEKIPKKFQNDFELEYRLDVESLFEYFSGILTKSGVSRLTKLNDSLVRQYANGLKKPSDKQRKKIERSLHDFGQQLLEIQL